MRILAVTNLYPNPFDPNRGTFNRQQLRAVAARHPVHVLSPIGWVDELRARRRGAPPLCPARRVRCDGVVVDHPRFLYPPRFLRRWHGHCFRWSLRPAFERAVAEFHPDLVFAAWAHPDGWAAVDLGHRAGLPVVLKVHGTDILGGRQHHPRRLQQTREALLEAEQIIAVSQDLAHHVYQCGVPAERVRVVYDGVDRQRFHPGPREEARCRLGLVEPAPLILFVGNLLPVKGLDVLLEALGRLVRASVRFQCRLVGQGPLREVLARQLARLGLRECVTLVGPRPHAELPDWFRAADLFVLPSRSEGVPCVLLEAMACGIPFVASQVGGIPEVAPAGQGKLVPAGDAARLAEAIDEQLRNPLPRVTSAAGLLRGHEEAAADLIRVFDEILQTRARATHVAGRSAVPELPHHENPVFAEPAPLPCGHRRQDPHAEHSKAPGPPS